MKINQKTTDMNLPKLMKEYLNNYQQLAKDRNPSYRPHEKDDVYLEDGFIVHFERIGYSHYKMTLADFMKNLKAQRKSLDTVKL